MRVAELDEEVDALAGRSAARRARGGDSARRHRGRRGRARGAPRRAASRRRRGRRPGVERSRCAATCSGSRAAGGEDVRRAPVLLGPGRRGHLLVDSGPDDRVDEVERRLEPQHVGAAERDRGVRRDVPVEARERGRVGDPGVAAEHRHGPREVVRLGGQPREPQRDDAGHGLGADLLDAGGLGRHRPHALCGERGEQGVEEERVAARGGEAGLGERGLRRGAERLLDHVRHGRGAERARPHDATCPRRRAARSGARARSPAPAAACPPARAAAAPRACGRGSRASAARARRPSGGRRSRAPSGGGAPCSRRASRGRAGSRTTRRRPPAGRARPRR